MVFELSVATLNLRNRLDRWPERRGLVVEQLAEVAADLISLQEISLPINQGRWLRDQVNQQLSGATDKPYRLLQQRKRHPVQGLLEGVGILSKLPILSHDAVSLGYNGRVALRANIELPDRRVLDFVAVHLHHEAHAKEARLEQVMTMMGWLNEYNRVPLQLLAGDFNEVPDGLAIQHMKQGYRSAYAEFFGREPLATCPTALVPSEDGWAGCLDYLFISPAFGAVRAARLFCDHPAAHDDSLYPSDHVGVLATLTIEEPL